jgi:murein DD-endopeptidase MepM/ murein hydrolase activator NlpD
MRKEKFVYNKQTLRYEKVVEPLKIKLLRGFAFVCAVLFFSAIVISIYNATVDSPEEKALKRELAQAKTQYKALSGQFDTYSKILENLKDRQQGAFAMAFGMNPIDSDVWNGGVGGARRYSNLTKYTNTGDLMLDVTKQADKLGRQMSTLSHTLDTIINMAKDRDKRFASIPSIKPIREDKLNRKIQLLSGFGMRLHPIHKVMRMHKGIDFSAPKGTPIYASGDGKVIKVENKKSGYGKNVVISHGYGYQSRYAHMSRMDVTVGETVKKGQVIGLVGSTGTSTAPHLHYEIYYMGKAVNPIHFVLDGLSTEEYQNLVDMTSISNQSFD